MIWRFLRATPQILIPLLIFGGSTAIFAVWWIFMGPPRSRPGRPVEDITPKLEVIKARPERLLLVDNSLYDFESGELLFREYVKSGAPNGLWFDAAAQKMIARYPAAYVRLNLAGQEEARVGPPTSGVFSAELDYVLFGRNKEIWRANVDWKAMRLVEERQLTDASMFMDVHFAGNVIFGTDATLLMRHLTKLLRIDLASGKIVESKMRLEGISKRLAPDFKRVAGFQGREFYCYEVDSEQAQTVRIPQGMVVDYQWLSPTRCLLLHSANELGVFEVGKEGIEVLVKLPVQCTLIVGPSPDGRHVFCGNPKQGFLVDLKEKTATEAPAGDGFFWVDSQSFLFAREGTDSEKRGTWLYTIGQGEKRISPLAYLVQKTGPSVLWMEKAGLLVLGMPGGLWSAERTGREARERIKLQSTPEVVLGIGDWKAPE